MSTSTEIVFYFFFSLNLIAVLAENDDDILVQDGGYSSGQSNSIVHASGKPQPDDDTSFAGLVPRDTSSTHSTESRTEERTTSAAINLLVNYSINDTISVDNSSAFMNLSTNGNCTELSCSSLAVRQFDIKKLIGCFVCNVSVLLIGSFVWLF